MKAIVSLLICYFSFAILEGIEAQAVSTNQDTHYVSQATKLINEEKNFFRLKNRIQALILNADQNQKNLLHIVLGKLHMDLLDFVSAKNSFNAALPLLNAHFELLRIAILEHDKMSFEQLFAKLPSQMNSTDLAQLKSLLAMAQLVFKDFEGLEKSIKTPKDAQALALSYLMAKNTAVQSLALSSQKKLEDSYSNSLWTAALRFSFNERIGFDLARGFLMDFSSSWPQDESETDTSVGGLELLQVGIFVDKKNAESILNKLTKLGFPARMETLDARKPVRYRITVEINRGVNPQELILALKEKGIEAFLSN